MSRESVNAPAPRLGADAALLFLSRGVRLFAYGSLSVILVLYLTEVGLDAGRIGALLTLTLLGDTAISLGMASVADRIGRRHVLVAGAVLMVAAGAVFAITTDFTLLLVAATVGVISPSGHEVGPFLSIEQAALAEIVPASGRTRLFAYYSLVGSLSTALGALAGGGLAQLLQDGGMPPLDSYRAIVIGYAGAGVLLGTLPAWLSPAVEALRPPGRGAGPLVFGLHGSRRVVAKLAALFALDAFGGGFVLQSVVAWWFHVRFGASPALLGAIFLGANLLAGVSALLAARIAARIGLLNTMVFTHIPSNLLLVLVPLMPTLPLAIALLLARFSISQMDVPTRQAFTMAAVAPDERSAAAGFTNVARTVGASLSPVIAGALLAAPALLGVPFFLAGGVKIAYDLLLYRSFRTRAVTP